MRLLTDTCAALKLAAFGNKLFRPGVLSNGDLIIHPRVFNETKKWPPFKKAKYKKELEILQEIKAAVGLRPPTGKAEALKSIIFATMDEISTSIGSADCDQLVAAIHSKTELVTNDAAFAAVAEALEVVVYTAERIVIEAFNQSVVTKSEVIAARALWKNNDEKPPSRHEAKELDSICK